MICSRVAEYVLLSHINCEILQNNPSACHLSGRSDQTAVWCFETNKNRYTVVILEP